MKSTPSLACFSIPAKKSSAVSSTHDFPRRLPSAAAWYRGTVPTGTGHAERIARRSSAIGPPVDRSITASAPAATAARIFSISSEMSAWSREEPTLAFTLTVSPSPTATGRISRRFRLRGMTTLPAAIRSLSVAGSTRSDCAARAIAGGISPCRARCISDMAYLPFRSEREKPRQGDTARLEEDHAPCAGITRVRFDGLPEGEAHAVRPPGGSQRNAPLAVSSIIRPGLRGCQTARDLYLPGGGGVNSPHRSSRFPGRFRLGPAHGGGDPPLGPPAQCSRDPRVAPARRRPSLHREGERLRSRRAPRGARPRGGRGAGAGRGHGGRRGGAARGGDPPSRRRSGGCRPAAGGGGPRPRSIGGPVRPRTDRLSRPRGGDGGASLPGARQGRHGDGAARSAPAGGDGGGGADRVESRDTAGRVDDAPFIGGRSGDGGPGVHGGAAGHLPGDAPRRAESVRGRRLGPRAEQR